MRGRWWTLTLRAVLAALLVVVAWTGIVLLTVRGDLRSAQAELERARAAEDAPAALAALTAAEPPLARAAGRLDQPGPYLARAVPLLGRTVAAVHRTAHAALAVTTASRRVLLVTEQGSLLRDGRVDPQRLAEVQQALTDGAAAVAAPVEALRQQPLGLVPGVVARPARAAREALDTAPARLAQGAAGARALHDVLGGSGRRDLLVLLENNAELRGTGGIVTVFAEATAVDGRLDVRAFREVEDVADPAARARPVPAPPDFVRLYGTFKAATTLWKNANMAPDVPTSSAVMAQVAAATTGRTPDVVLWLDVPAIAAVLRATGPAELRNGEVLEAEEVVPRLLSTAYLRAPDSATGQARRRAELREAADAVVRRLLGAGDAQPASDTLARELFAAARGRHLALWSSDAMTQQDLHLAGLAGAVAAGGGDLSAFAVHNLGGGDAQGNKLDYYARRQTTVRVRLSPDHALVEQEVAVRNTAPPRGLPAYVAGRVTPGVSNMFVTMALPRQAEVRSFTRDDGSASASPLPSGDHRVLTDVVALPPGRVATWRLRYRLPLTEGRYRLALYPQPLAVDAGLLLEITGGPGVQLAPGHGVGSEGVGLRTSGPFSTVLRVDVAVDRPGRITRWRERVRRFWQAPVELP